MTPAADTTSIHHFGEALRAERQRRSVSLEDIAQTTKVTVRSLTALESDAFDQLPGGILAKGIVRSYVRCLGLDESEWVDRFLDASGQKIDPDPTQQKDWVSFAMNVSTTHRSGITDTKLRWVGVFALLLLLAGFGWFVWGFVHQRATALRATTFTHYSGSILPAVSAHSVSKKHHAHLHAR